MDKLTRTLPGGGKIQDDRSAKEKAATRFFAVATDKFMSGWGEARGGKSYYALPCATLDEAEVCARNLELRSEMKRVRIVDAGWRPKLRAGDHLSIANRESADRHYIPGGFA